MFDGKREMTEWYFHHGNCAQSKNQMYKKSNA